MSNEIKKPSDEASKVSVARYSYEHFAVERAVKSLVRAHEMPFQYFCEKKKPHIG